jgi:hypothetical protein
VSFCHQLASVVCRPLTFHILIFSSETPQPNELVLGRKHDQDEMSNLYRGPSIDASYQVLIHLAKRFQRRRFKKIGQSETRIACGGHVCLYIKKMCFWFCFLAHLAKGNVSFCHHLASVVCPLTFHILIFSSETPSAK